MHACARAKGNFHHLELKRKKGNCGGHLQTQLESGFLAAFFGFYVTFLFAFSEKYQTVFLIDIFEAHYG